MTKLLVPSVFFKFADGTVDPAPDYDSPNAVRIDWGLSGFHGPNRHIELSELAICLKEMLGDKFTDDELSRLWWASNATIKYGEPRRLRDFLQEALSTIERELT